MSSLTRRAVLHATTALVPAIYLAGCAGQTQAQIATEISTDISAVGNGFQGFVPALSAALPGLSTSNPSLITNVTLAVSAVEQNATNIGQAIAQGVAVHGIAQALDALQTGVHTIDTDISPYYAQAPIIAQVIQAAIALIQIVVGLVNAAPAPTPSPVPALAFKGAAAAGTWTESSAAKFLNTRPLAR